MSELSREEKLKIAKEAYRQIKNVIDYFESRDIDICAHWDECISVDKEFFAGGELRDGN